MAHNRICPQGHTWHAEEPDGDLCPQCGAAGETDDDLATEAGFGNDLPPAPRTAVEVAVKWPTFVGYQIVAEIGRGGMGVVYKATQLSLARVVALKVLAAGLRADAEALRRFRGEAEMIARLAHPNIVQIFDVIQQEETVCFVMEYVEGGNLQERSAAQAMDPIAAAELVRTLARAVHAAHERGIIHRDLKPANILIATDGRPRIADFGLAKRLDGGGAGGTTRSGYIMGTPHYMAPEQAEGSAGQVGPTTDVYALGAILYELLTGRPPFCGESVAHILKQVLFDAAVSPSRYRANIPPELETICLKCLCKKPAQRYPSAATLADALDAFLPASPQATAVLSGPAPAHSIIPEVRSTSPLGLRRRLLLPIACFVFLALSAGLVYGPVIHEWLFHNNFHPAAQHVKFRWEVLPGPATVQNEVFDRVAFPTRDIGYLASRQAIYKTSDGGKQWTALKLAAPGRTHVLHFATDQVGWLGTDRLRETKDGGTSWADIELGEPMRTVSALAIHPDGWGLVGGTGAAGKLALFRNDGVGPKWRKIDLAADLKERSDWFLGALAVTSSKTALAVIFQGEGEGGAVFRSTDAGQSWVSVFTSTEDLYRVQLDADGAGWLTGLGGAIWQTKDAGATFAPYENPHPDGFTPACFAFDPRGNLGLAPLWKGNVLVKVGNASWEVQSTPLGYLLPHAVVVDPECAYLLGGDGRLARLKKVPH